MQYLIQYTIYFICSTSFPFGSLDMAVYTVYIYAIFPRLMPLLAQFLWKISLGFQKLLLPPTKSFIIHRLPLLYIAGNISSQLLTNRYTHPRTHTHFIMPKMYVYLQLCCTNSCITLLSLKDDKRQRTKRRGWRKGRKCIVKAVERKEKWGSMGPNRTTRQVSWFTGYNEDVDVYFPFNIAPQSADIARSFACSLPMSCLSKLSMCVCEWVFMCV